MKSLLFHAAQEQKEALALSALCFGEKPVATGAQGRPPNNCLEIVVFIVA
jgi:hypothetical protein